MSRQRAAGVTVGLGLGDAWSVEHVYCMSSSKLGCNTREAATTPHRDSGCLCTLLTLRSCHCRLFEMVSTAANTAEVPMGYSRRLILFPLTISRVTPDMHTRDIYLLQFSVLHLAFRLQLRVLCYHYQNAPQEPVKTIVVTVLQPLTSHT